MKTVRKLAIVVSLFSSSFVIAFATGSNPALIWPNCAQQGTIPCASGYDKGTPGCTNCCNSHCAPPHSGTDLSNCIKCCAVGSSC